MYRYKRRKQSGGNASSTFFGNVDMNELLSGVGNALQGFSNEPALQDMFSQSDALFNNFQNQTSAAGIEDMDFSGMKPVFDMFSIFSNGLLGGGGFEKGGTVSKPQRKKLKNRVKDFSNSLEENLIEPMFESKKAEAINQFNMQSLGNEISPRKVIPGMVRENSDRVMQSGGGVNYNPNKVDVGSYLGRFNKRKDSITSKDISIIQDRLMEYGHKVTPEFIISQAQLEGVFNNDGGRSKKNNPFNVGEYDSGTKMKFDSREQGITAFADLLAKDYLSGNRTEDDLLKEYVNQRGSRYASNPNYENDLRGQINYIRSNYQLPTPPPNFQPPNDIMALQTGGQIPISPQGQFAFPNQPVMVPTPDGTISMDGVPNPIFAMGMNGEMGILPPNSGMYQFASDLVYEAPIKNKRVKGRRNKKVKDDNKGLKTGTPKRTAINYNKRNARTQRMNKRGNIGLPFGNKIGY